jgi:methionyl-tRNA synthetase
VKKTFYITTTLPYVNAQAHVGHALEFVRADSIARFKRLQGFEVFFNTGTDEHGTKVYTKARELGLDVQKYVDEYAEKFKEVHALLGISYTSFCRTTDPRHRLVAQEFWRRSMAQGDIYKKNYTTKYCVGCELERTESELVNGKCPLHQDRELELISEENYFFRYSRFAEPLLEYYQKTPDFVIPSERQKEIIEFTKRGLQDFSISRLKSKMPWGVSVPDDKDHVMYVWFDALTSYIDAIGWPDDLNRFEKWSPMVQYCGKDNLRQQSSMWQAMLLSVGLPLSRHIVVDGFVTAEGGVKMSKSLGNAIDPIDLVKKYGTDAVRYYLLRELSTFEDSPCTLDLFHRAYTTGLVNGLGNLASRLFAMALSYTVAIPAVPSFAEVSKRYPQFSEALERFEVKRAFDCVFELIGQTDKAIQTTEPFKRIKTDPEGASADIVAYLHTLAEITALLEPLLPETHKKLVESFTAQTKPILFPRIQ